MAERLGEAVRRDKGPLLADDEAGNFVTGEGMELRDSAALVTSPGLGVEEESMEVSEEAGGRIGRQGSVSLLVVSSLLSEAYESPSPRALFLLEIRVSYDTELLQAKFVHILNFSQIFLFVAG